MKVNALEILFSKVVMITCSVLICIGCSGTITYTAIRWVIQKMPNQNG